MSTKVEKTIQVDVPVRTAYNQWTQFEEFPQFMGGISKVTQLNDRTLHWEAEIAGVKRQWDAAILEQEPDSKIAWAATSGATNAGAVFFTPLGASKTSITLHLEYEPEGIIESAGDKLGFIEKRAEADLEKFKTFIEKKGFETGAWRGDVEGSAGLPGVEDASASIGDSGKAGFSGKVIAGAALAAGAAVAAKTLGGSSDNAVEEIQNEDLFATEPTAYAAETAAPAPATYAETETVTPIAPYPPVGYDAGASILSEDTQSRPI